MMKQFRFLVLSCSTGEGHNSAAKAVYHRLQSLGHDCELVDALSFAGQKISRQVCDLYSSITLKSPRAFQALYKAGGAISSARHKSPIYYLNNLYSQKLYDYLLEGGFDGVVTSHLFPAQTLTGIIRKYGISLPTLGIATDYTSIPFWEETELAGYIVPHESLLEEFAPLGREKLHAFGIPVDHAFCETTPQEEACRALDIPLDREKFLILSGSMGFGDPQAILSSVLRQAEFPFLTVVCGNNDTLAAQLRERYGEDPRVRILGYTDQVSLLMDACDVVFTKPGGLSSTEAAVKRIPLVHTAPIPGCETKNMEFFGKLGLSVHGETADDCAGKALSLIHDSALRKRMIEAQGRQINPHACDDICSLLCALAEKEG